MSWDKHLNAVSLLMKSVGAVSGFCANSTIGPLATVSSLALAAAACGNVGKAVKDVGLLFAAEED